MHPTSWSAGAWARIYRRSAQHGVRCCPVAKLARFAVQLSHQMPKIKPVFMVSVSRFSVRNSCCARGHDKMDTLLRSPDEHSMQFAMHNKRATCFGHAGLSSVRQCKVQIMTSVACREQRNCATCFDICTVCCAAHRVTSSVQTFTI